MEPTKKKSKRVTQACNYCKLKRVKCTGDCPCQKCIYNNIECTYSVTKKRGRKVKFDEADHFKKFSDACNYLHKGIPINAPNANNEDPKYNILINYELINNLYQHASFELIPFLNLKMINDRIYNKEIYFSLLFSLYAVSEILKPYGDYNVALKYKIIAVQFIELTRLKNTIKNIQIYESLYILSLIDSGEISDYFYSRSALISLSELDLNNIEIPKCEADTEEKKNNYINIIFTSIVIKYMYAQISTGLIEDFELKNLEYENLNDLVIEKDNNTYTNAVDTINAKINVYKNQKKMFLMEKIRSDYNFANKLNINSYTGEFDIDDLLSIKYNGKNILSLNTMRSLNFHFYMNQPEQWVILAYYQLSFLRNTLFLYTNVVNENMKFKASIFINEDCNLQTLQDNLPTAYRFKSFFYRTEPIPMFLYKRRFFGSFLGYRMFLYRVILKLVLNSSSSEHLISKLKVNINKNLPNTSNKRFSVIEKNKNLYNIYSSYRQNRNYPLKNNTYYNEPDNKYYNSYDYNNNSNIINDNRGIQINSKNDFNGKYSLFSEFNNYFNDDNRQPLVLNKMENYQYRSNSNYQDLDDINYQKRSYKPEDNYTTSPNRDYYLNDDITHDHISKKIRTRNDKSNYYDYNDPLSNTNIYNSNNKNNKDYQQLPSSIVYEKKINSEAKNSMSIEYLNNNDDINTKNDSNSNDNNLFRIRNPKFNDSNYFNNSNNDRRTEYHNDQYNKYNKLPREFHRERQESPHTNSSYYYKGENYNKTPLFYHEKEFENLDYPLYKINATNKASPKYSFNNSTHDHIKFNYYINERRYIEMDADEFNEFISSCIYHQVTFVLKNLISKSIDFLLNQYIYFSRLARFKEIQQNKQQYYELPVAPALYEVGVIFLAKYVANNGSDDYNDNLITFITNIDELHRRIIENPSESNWYLDYYSANNPDPAKQDNYDNYNETINKNSNSNRNDTDYQNYNKSYSDYPRKENEPNYLSSDRSPVNSSYNNNNTNTERYPTNNYEREDKKNEDNINSYNVCDVLLDRLFNIRTKDKKDISLRESLHEFIDSFYEQNLNEKCGRCSACINDNHGKRKTKAEFTEILKLLKYFYNLDLYNPEHCYIYNSNGNINNYIYSCDTHPTFQLFLNELVRVEAYFKTVGNFVSNFRELIQKANYALAQNRNSFNMESDFRNSFF